MTLPDHPFRFLCFSERIVRVCPFRSNTDCHRINKATTLLAETDKPVFQIASMVGFENPTFFTKLFHRYMGTTPSQCRT